MMREKVERGPADAGGVAVFPPHDGGFIDADEGGDLFEGFPRGLAALAQAPGGQGLGFRHEDSPFETGWRDFYFLL